MTFYKQDTEFFHVSAPRCGGTWFWRTLERHFKTSNWVRSPKQKLASYSESISADKFASVYSPHEGIFLVNYMNKFQNSKVIHLIRNPFDVVASMKVYFANKGVDKWWLNFMNEGEIELYNNLSKIEQYCFIYMIHIRNAFLLRGDDRYYEIKYEELMKNPKRILNNIHYFLFLQPMPDDMIEEIIATMKPSIGKYKDVLTDDEITAVRKMILRYGDEQFETC